MIHVFSLLYEFILISSPLYVHTYVPTYIHMCIHLFFLPPLPLLPDQSLRFWAPFPILREKGKLVWTGTEERSAAAVLALHGLERFPSVFWISSSFIIAYEKHGQHQPLPGTLPGRYRPSFSSTPCPCTPHSRQRIRTAGYPNNQRLAYKYLLHESDLIDFSSGLCEVISWFAVDLTWVSEGNARLLELCWAHHLHKPTKKPWETCFSISITSIGLVIKEMLST